MTGKQQRKRAARRHDDPALVREAEEIVGQIQSLWRDLFRSPFDAAREAGITAPQVRLMAALVSRRTMTLTELSQTLGMTHSTASGIVDRLQARGLVRRSPHPRDRRRTIIAVTDRVKQYVDQLETGPAGRLAAALGAASAGQRRVIRRALATLRTMLLNH